MAICIGLGIHLFCILVCVHYTDAFDFFHTSIFVVDQMTEIMMTNMSTERAKETLHLCEALYVAIKRGSPQSAEKYLSKAEKLGLLKEVCLP